jgi:hypothetical protein
MSDNERIRQHLQSAMVSLTESKEKIDHAQDEIEYALTLLDEGGEVPINPPPLGHDFIVGPADDLLAVIEGAPSGSVILIDPSYTGELSHWTLTKTLTLKTSGDLPPFRATLDDDLPVLRGFLEIMAPNVTLIGLRFETPTKEGTAITAGPGMTMERCVVMGSPEGAHRGILVNVADVTITGCHVGNIWRDIDTQAIAGWNGTRNLLVDDCFLEASGENVLFGGADCSNEETIPQDITVSGCHLFKPLSWRDKPGLTAKNLYELKNGKRIVMINCLLENSWANGQVGFAVVLTVRNQDGSNPFATIEDCLIENCTTRNSAGGINVMGLDDYNPSKPMSGMVIRNNSFENISYDFGGNGRQIQISGGPVNLMIENNLFSCLGLVNTFITFDQPDKKLSGFIFRGNQGHEGEYGIMGTDAPGGGKVAVDFYCPNGYAWENNTVIDDGERDIEYPPGTVLVKP